MKIYISSPINNRPEPTMAKKLAGSYDRVLKLAWQYRDWPGLTDAEFVSTFDVNDRVFAEYMTEAEALSNCVRLLMECDAIIVDRELGIKSKGMDVEEFVAQKYGLKIIQHNGTKNK